ncbi:unnamed protein product [Mucor fragilis]
MTNTSTLHVSQHPIIATKLSQLRDAKKDSKVVRELTQDLSVLLGYEASSGLALSDGESNTASAFGSYQSVQIKDKVGLVPVLRSGLGFVNGFLNLFPEAPVYHLGIYREKVSHQPVEYYNKLPDVPNVETCFVLDPVIATGNTAVATINILKEWGLSASQIKFVAIVGVSCLSHVCVCVNLMLCVRTIYSLSKASSNSSESIPMFTSTSLLWINRSIPMGKHLLYHAVHILIHL